MSRFRLIGHDASKSSMSPTALPKSIDFDPVADLYDLHLTATFDIPFWVDEARRHEGPRLELMCGTGRISLPILRAGLALDCVDYSVGMLATLRAKLAREGLKATLLERDARQLGFTDSFAWAFIGFHAFSELVEREDQVATLRSLREALHEDGRATLSLQNPRLRRGQLTGDWLELGAAPIPGTTHRLDVRGRYVVDPATDLVTGLQVYRELEASGRCVSLQELPVRFRLVEPDELVELARAEGFRLVQAWGDYERAPFELRSSPYFLASFSRT